MPGTANRTTKRKEILMFPAWADIIPKRAENMLNHVKTILDSNKIIKDHACFMLKHPGIMLVHGESC